MPRLWILIASLVLTAISLDPARAAEKAPTGPKNVTAAPTPASRPPVGEDELRRRLLVVKTTPKVMEADVLENPEESGSSEEEEGSGKKEENRSSNMFQQEEEDRGDSDVSEERYRQWWDLVVQW